jgi:hypothetical protein
MNTESIHKYLQQQNQAKLLSKNYQNILGLPKILAHT